MNNQVVNVDLNIDGETLNVEAINTRRNNNTTSKNVINSMNTNNNYVEVEKEGWRSKFLAKICATAL